ncbi:MAG: DUF86 domain-containing protein [Gemmatimonadetes bacterium]|nr:DUF86 domain-containing protein [Gemmatimonadota bacterium]
MVARFARLEQALRRLRAHASVGLDGFLHDADLRDIVDRNFQIAVEALIDLANYVVASRGLPKPETSADLFDVLHRAALLPEWLARALRGWVGFGNVLVPQYTQIAYQLVHKALTVDLKELDEAARAFGELLADELGG